MDEIMAARLQIIFDACVIGLAGTVKVMMWLIADRYHQKANGFFLTAATVLGMNMLWAITNFCFDCVLLFTKERLGELTSSPEDSTERDDLQRILAQHQNATWVASKFWISLVFPYLAMGIATGDSILHTYQRTNPDEKKDTFCLAASWVLLVFDIISIFTHQLNAYIAVRTGATPAPQELTNSTTPAPQSWYRR